MKRVVWSREREEEGRSEEKVEQLIYILRYWNRACFQSSLGKRCLEFRLCSTVHLLLCLHLQHSP